MIQYVDTAVAAWRRLHDHHRACTLDAADGASRCPRISPIRIASIALHPLAATNAYKMTVARRLRDLQIQLQAQRTSMRDYSGDPNYLGQKVNCESALRQEVYIVRMIVLPTLT